MSAPTGASACPHGNALATCTDEMCFLTHERGMQPTGAEGAAPNWRIHLQTCAVCSADKFCDEAAFHLLSPESFAAVASSADSALIRLVISTLKDYALFSRAALASSQQDVERLRERLKLVDHVCHSHHTASFMPEQYDTCPICAEHGGVQFYAENVRLYRGGSSDGRTA